MKPCIKGYDVGTFSPLSADRIVVFFLAGITSSFIPAMFKSYNSRRIFAPRYLLAIVSCQAEFRDIAIVQDKRNSLSSPGSNRCVCQLFDIIFMVLLIVEGDHLCLIQHRWEYLVLCRRCNFDLGKNLRKSLMWKKKI